MPDPNRLDLGKAVHQTLETIISRLSSLEAELVADRQAAAAAPAQTPMPPRVAAAGRAFREGPWPAMTATARGKLLARLADLVAANAARLAEIDRGNRYTICHAPWQKAFAAAALPEGGKSAGHRRPRVVVRADRP